MTNNPSLRNRLSYHQQKILSRIQDCAQQNCGYVTSSCKDCGNEEFVAPCACNDRSCPSCGAARRADWAERVSARHPETDYFHVVFTLPHELNEVILRNQKELLSALCRTAARTLLEFSRDEKLLGGVPYLMTVLHTWTQDLSFHPHVHCLISAGALTTDLKKWVTPSNPKFLFPVHALAKFFRGSFLKEFSDLVCKGAIEMPPMYRYEGGFIEFASKLPKKWIVYSQPPYKGRQVVIKYFANYANRCGIADSRILGMDSEFVLIKPKRDSAEREEGTNGPKQNNVIKIKHDLFFLRFFSHVLPKGFHKIHYYGLSSPGAAKKKLPLPKA